MKANSLRLRLLLLAALSIATTLSIAGVSLVLIFERHIDRRVEQELDVRWTELASAFSLDRDGKPELSRELSDPRYRQPQGGAYWQVSDDKGALLRSRSLWDDLIPGRIAKDGRDETRAFESKGPGDSTIYVIERPITVGADDAPQRYRLAVALDHADIDALRDTFGKDVALALTLLAAVLWCGAWMQTSIGLRPLHELRRALTRLHEGHDPRLHGRFPEEVEALAQDLNSLIDHQNAVLAKARDRAGNLAHGLKTPLTILTGEAQRMEAAGFAKGAKLIREQVNQMRAHVERELARARAQGPAAPGGLHTDALRTVDRLVSLMRRMPRGESLSWRVAIPPGTRLAMDPDDFAEVLGNLLDNARKWATTRVAVGLESVAGRTHLVVADDGPGIPRDLRDRIVQRGERAATDGDGTGLGLSIVDEVLSEYGTRLVIADVDDGCRISFDIDARTRPADTSRPAQPAAKHDAGSVAFNGNAESRSQPTR